ncbi:hypothetical protein NUW54_g1148 [Trametes sanguinea]|uniref:Uncharacterized protein n=2 Tax=Trametes sanguinea TaxID=158606 RepID=A0ACC1Q721_9APHY|nr:hypothetical protein NUW54_g2537 [Trametes sanguinea]KAJ3015045.1 hypothetical protein NUW54_g1148 [Trametes sanguinea]
MPGLPDPQYQEDGSYPDYLHSAAELEAEHSTKAGQGNMSSVGPAVIEIDTSEDDLEGTESEEEDADDSAQPIPRQDRSKAKKSLTIVDKLHTIVVGILHSEVRRARMHCLIQQLCDKDVRHLVPVRSMPTRWNTVFAEIERGLFLRPVHAATPSPHVINAWVEQMDKGLTGRKKAAATQQKNCLFLSPRDWAQLEAIRDILSPFNDVTHLLSKGDVPTLPMVLPLYKHLESHLKAQKTKLRSNEDLPLHHGCQKALDKLTIYMEKALYSNAPSHDTFEIARELLAELYDEYSELYTSPQSAQCGENTGHGTGDHNGPLNVQQPSVFGTSVAVVRADPATTTQAGKPRSKLEIYLNDEFPCTNEDGALQW